MIIGFFGSLVYTVYTARGVKLGLTHPGQILVRDAVLVNSKTARFPPSMLRYGNQPLNFIIIKSI